LKVLEADNANNQNIFGSTLITLFNKNMKSGGKRAPKKPRRQITNMKVLVSNIEWDSENQIDEQKEFVVDVSDDNEAEVYSEALNKVSELTGYLICYAEVQYAE
jgi:hypothetical protein